MPCPPPPVTDGTFTVKGLDAMKGHDLMIWRKDGYLRHGRPDRASRSGSPQIQHLLARITFAARSEVATLRTFASLEGLDVKGDYDSGKETLWSNTAEGTVSVEKETPVTPAGNVDVSGDLLLIPHRSRTG